MEATNFHNVGQCKIDRAGSEAFKLSTLSAHVVSDLMFSVANSLIQFGSEYLSNFWFRLETVNNRIAIVSTFKLTRTFIVPPEGI